MRFGGDATPAGILPKIYIVVLLACIAVRVGIVSRADPERVFTQWSNIGDATLYDRFGWNLSEYGVMGARDTPSAFVMPGYPVVLALVYTVFGHHPGAARWIQILLSLLTAIVLGRLAQTLDGRRAELIAVTGTAFYPFFIYFVPEILTETLFLLLFSCMMITAINVGRRGSSLDGLVHGLCLTAAFMTRSVALFMEPGLLLLARPWSRAGRPRRLTGLLLGGVVFLAVWAGWIARNYSVFGTFVPLDTHGGFMLYTSQLISRGYDHEAVVRKTREDLGYYRYDIENGLLPGGPQGELDADRRAAQRAHDMMHEDPWSTFRKLPRNVLALWLGLDFREVGRQATSLGFASLAGWLTYLPVLLLSPVGMLRLIKTRRWDLVFAFSWILIVTTVLFGLTHGGKRFRVATIDPVLIILAASAVATWRTDRWRRRRDTGPAGPVTSR